MIEKYIKIPENQIEFYQYIKDYIKKISIEYQNTEHNVPEEILKKHTKELIELGIINLDTNDNEFALWNYEQKHNLLFSILCLLELSIINGSLGYIAHQFALSTFINRSLNLSLDISPWNLTQGNYGIARNLLAKYLFSQIDKNDWNALKQYFEMPQPITIQIPDFVEYLSFFSIDEQNLSDNSFTLRLAKIHSRKQQYPSHGFDEIKTSEIHYEIIQSYAVSSSLFTEILSRQILGNLSIATARLIYAFLKALKYTNERIQGGHLIFDYPAIQNLLFNAESTIELSLNSLFQCGTYHSEKDLLLKVLRIKKQIMPLIVYGISDCLQTHGGYGYMRDYGLEKAYRDANHLKQLYGTSNEISLFIAEVYKNKINELL